MRIALLLCGQMRTFDHPKVNEYVNKLIDKFNCDVFVSTWKDRGVFYGVCIHKILFIVKIWLKR